MTVSGQDLLDVLCQLISLWRDVRGIISEYNVGTFRPNNEEGSLGNMREEKIRQHKKKGKERDEKTAGAGSPSAPRKVRGIYVAPASPNSGGGLGGRLCSLHRQQ